MVFSSRQMVFYVVTRKILGRKQKCGLDRAQSTLAEGEFPLHAQNLALYKFYFQNTLDGTSGIMSLGDYYIVKILVQNGKNFKNPRGKIQEGTVIAI